MIPYSRQSIDQTDLDAVGEVLRSAWLTTGPKVLEFEEAFASYVGVAEAVALNSGTAALHAAMHAYSLKPGDEVIVPANTFVASANAVLYLGATPVFADVEPDTLLMDPKDVAAKITHRTKGIIAVDFAGQPCDYNALGKLASQANIFLHADACHALGASFERKKVGSLAQTNSFSFHPVKPITTSEGGMVTTMDSSMAKKMRAFRNHGIETDARQREIAQTWEYDMTSLGYNYRLSDLQSALGISQLKRLDQWVKQRERLAELYRKELAKFDWIEPLPPRGDRTHAYHLFVTRLRGKAEGKQGELFQFLRSNRIGAHIMYRPVYLHGYYQKTFGHGFANCPEAEKAYKSIMTLPIFPEMKDSEIDKVIFELASFEQKELSGIR